MIHEIEPMDPQIKGETWEKSVAEDKEIVNWEGAVEIEIGDEEVGLRLDKLLSLRFEESSRAWLQKLIREGRVEVQGQEGSSPSTKLRQGDRVRVAYYESSSLPPERLEDIPAIALLYEDEDILVIDKEAGIVCHPGAGARRVTVSDMACAHCGVLLPSPPGEARPGIVHRLDRETSGVMVLAKTIPAMVALQKQFHDRVVQKEYLAIVFGTPRFISDWITVPLERDPKRPERIRVAPLGGRVAETYYEVKERFREFAFLLCRPKTGRTHQIRVHLDSVHHSIVGDRVYRSRKVQGIRIPEDAPIPKRQALHSCRLEFVHPVSGERMAFETPMPGDMRMFLRWLQENRSIPKEKRRGR
jgi:23S rRNA pseudouridine1911/1915/1917 synthase